jgi:hypothetical protein
MNNTPMQYRQTEKQLQSGIIEAINYSGLAWVWNVNAGRIPIETTRGRRMFQAAPAGHADIQGIRRKDGKFIAIEVKLPNRRKNVTEKQMNFLREIKLRGGITGVVTNHEEALSIIEGTL